jgi:hypothetical protein
MPDDTTASDERTAQLVDEPVRPPEGSDRDDQVPRDSEDRRAETRDHAVAGDELMPGDKGPGAVGAIWSMDAANSLRGRWQELQLRFVDDPRGVVTEAQALVDEAVRGLTRALTEQQGELDGWTSAGNGDTETLRVALQRYREFFDRVLNR